jgi:hypothetical protein
MSQMQYTLIGIREFKEVQSTHSDHGDTSEEIVQYYIYLMDEEKQNFYAFQAQTEYGSCCSGWTTATTASFTELEQIHKMTDSIHYEPKEKNLKVQFSERKENTYEYDLHSSQDSNKWIVKCSEEGGDQYYPSGDCKINKDLLKQTIRCPEKRVVYVFTGASGNGKSFLSGFMRDDFAVYETDMEEKLPEDIAKYNIIVVGNKYNNQICDIWPLLEAGFSEPGDINIIKVEFSALSANGKRKINSKDKNPKSKKTK